MTPKRLEIWSGVFCLFDGVHITVLCFRLALGIERGDLRVAIGFINSWEERERESWGDKGNYVI